MKREKKVLIARSAGQECLVSRPVGRPRIGEEVRSVDYIGYFTKEEAVILDRKIKMFGKSKSEFVRQALINETLTSK